MDYYIFVDDGSRILLKGVGRITRKSWLFPHKIVFWPEGASPTFDLPLAVFRDHDVRAIVAVQEGTVRTSRAS